MSLGIEISAEEILDPVAFRETFFFGTALAIPANKAFFSKAAEAMSCGLTTDDVKRKYMAMLRGNVPDEIIVTHLKQHLSQAAISIGIPLTLETILTPPLDEGISRNTYDRIVEPIAWNRSHSTHWNMVYVPYPIVRIIRVRTLINGEVATTLPTDSYTVTSATNGAIKVSSVSGALHGLDYVGATAGRRLEYPENDTLAAPSCPAYWAVDYVSGPNAFGTVPEALRQHVWWSTCQYLLNLNSTMLSKGMSSQSRSVDGVSNSISITNSAMYDLNSALKLTCSEMLKAHPITNLRRAMAGMKVRRY